MDSRELFDGRVSIKSEYADDDLIYRPTGKDENDHENKEDEDELNIDEMDEDFDDDDEEDF